MLVKSYQRFFLEKLLFDDCSLHFVMIKATIIGVGNLGSCIAYEIAVRDFVDRIVLVDVYHELAEGNALDIAQAIAFRNDTEVLAGSYEEASDSNVIVVTAGKPRTPDMKSRMELLEANTKIIKSVALELKKLGGASVIITLTNPMDVMNYVMWKTTAMDKTKILGSGGMLDSARLRTVLASKYGVSSLDVDAYVIGEHGENQVPVFSQVRLGNRKKTISEVDRVEVMNKLRDSALQVISKKGATIYAPACNTANMVEAIIKDEKKLAVCSCVLNGEYGLQDVSIGVPVILGRNGIEKVVEWKLDDNEKTLFLKGAHQLKETIKSIFGL
ncbi:malate dehydrogenase [Candidatus Bathyarchaeota archaeon]|nr:malate dehydrogenase [Candidatus Bathyarchaeota archaeon]